MTLAPAESPLPPGGDAREHGRLLSRVREAALHGGTPPAAPRAVIGASWRRMRWTGLDPAGSAEVPVLGTGELQRRREASALAPLLPTLRARLLPLVPVTDIWGVARATAAKLAPLGIRTAGDLAAMPPALARTVGTVVLERLVRELNGDADPELQVEPRALQATAVTRCFGAPVTRLKELREAMVRHAVRATEKIRADGLVARRLIAFAHNFRFRAGPKYNATRHATLSPASNDPRVAAAVAGRLAEAIYRPGIEFEKCGVLLEDLQPAGRAQLDLFADADPRGVSLIEAIDTINRRFGRHAVRIAAEGVGQKRYETRRSLKSPCWTTRLSDIPAVR